MSKANNNIPRAALHFGNPAKSFSAAEGYEAERRGWDEKTYHLKNLDSNNHYDYTRKHLNFEINSKGEIVPLCSHPVPLHERLLHRLDELNFKPYKDKKNPLANSDNSPNCTVGIMISGDHDLLTRLAYGQQDVDFDLKRSNAHIKLHQEIKDWAMDTYKWACGHWGAENIIGFDVHFDETTPHIHIQTIPVVKTKARGRAAVKYVHKEDKTRVLSRKEWKKLSEDQRNDFIKTEAERREKECVSYALVWGEDKYVRGKTYYNLHTDYYKKVGKKYGLERGDDIALLPEEEKRERVHKNKAVLEAERQAKNAIINAQVEKKRVEQQKSRIENETASIKSQKERLESKVSLLEDYAAILDIKQDDLKVPALKTDQLVKDAHKAIQEELDKPIPAFGQKEWRDERKKAVKQILTDMQTELFNAKELQKQDILNLGRSLYKQAMKEAAKLVEQNELLQKENHRLSEENTLLGKRIASMDATAINNLRIEKDAEIRKLQNECDRANSHATRSDNIVAKERQRAENAENLLQEVLSIPEIKEIWDFIQQNQKLFWQQIDKWIGDAAKAIAAFAKDYEHTDFLPEQKNTIGQGIIAEAFRQNLDATDDKQRMKAAHFLLDEVSWTGTTKFMSDLASTRTEQLCNEMTVSNELVSALFLAAAGRGNIGTGGGGSDNELTNWDGTKKRNGWGL